MVKLPMPFPTLSLSPSLKLQFRIKEMADRYFPNEMPNFVAEEDQASSAAEEDSLMKLLYTPYSSLSKNLKRAALDLKETIVMETWGITGQRVKDFTLYTGTLGTAFILFKVYQDSNDKNDLNLCYEIIKACDTASLGSRGVTFLCGRAGICALGALVANLAGDKPSLARYLTQFKEIELPKNLPDELLYGRVGYLWACLFLNKHLGDGTISSEMMRPIVREVIENGRALGRKEKCPLMFEWHGKRYWGGAHGLAGIMNVLMEVDLKPDEAEDVKGTLRYMIENRFPSGNYPAKEEDKGRDVLVHWCHGATGVAITLVNAAKVFGEQDFLKAAIEASEVVWNRGLLKRVGICHGISGNAYVFLSLFRLTGDPQFLYKAKAFSSFLLDRAHKLIAQGDLHGGDHHYSLFEGIAGMASLFIDMVDPSASRFPGYEI